MSKSLHGAELLDVGTWPAMTGPVTISLSAIDALVSSFDALGLSRKVPLKLGHNEDQPVTDGQPALGWVSRLWREGTKLMADFVDMPDVIHAAIQKKLYKTVSVEVARDVQAGTRKIPWVLEAVALLGADQPAVGTLKDLEALLTARKPVLQARARVAFQRDIKLSSGGPGKGMEKAEVEALLKEQETRLSAKFSADLKKVTDDSAAALAAEQKKTRDAEIARHRDTIKAKFETAIKSEIIKPATRESFYRLTGVDTDRVLEIKVEDADAYITEHADKSKLSKEVTTKSSDKVDQDEIGKSAAEVVALRARKLCFSRQQDPNKFEHINAATFEVLKADKALGEAYKVLGEAPTKAA